jgi:hypothetical protein
VLDERLLDRHHPPDDEDVAASSKGNYPAAIAANDKDISWAVSPPPKPPSKVNE